MQAAGRGQGRGCGGSVVVTERTTEGVSWRATTPTNGLQLPVRPPKLRLCPLRSPEDRGSLAAPSCCFWHTDRKVASLEILVFASEGKIWV